MRDKLLTISQIQFVRYLFAAGIATVVDNLVFVLIMYVWKDDFLDDKILRATAVCAGYAVGLVTNFWLSKVFVFQASQLRLRTQFVRFTLVALIVLGVRLGIVELLYRYVELTLPVFDSLKDLLFIGTASVITAAVSFTIHKFFSFRV